jgi:hypothetical protein
MLGVHPQAVFETCAHLAGHGNTPARQWPDLAVVLTAGLAAEHDMRGEYGIDIEDLNPGHSLRTEPGVRRVRDAAELVDDDVWITVTSPGDFEGAESDPTPGGRCDPAAGQRCPASRGAHLGARDAGPQCRRPRS